MIEKMIQLQNQFAELYCEGGLISIQSTYIHVKNDFFKQHCMEGKVTVEQVGHCLHTKAMVLGTTFLTVF